jgi:phosphatidylglycerophosphatase C
MPDIAAFDFDGTLTTGGSVFSFLSAVTNRGKVTAASASLLPQLAHAALAGGEKADRIKERLFVQVLAGVSLTRLTSVSAHFAFDHVGSHLRDDVRRRFDWHLGRGDHVAIVSASPECYVREAAALLGAEIAIATRLAVDDSGRLTGRYEGRNCRGEEKLRRLNEWISDLAMPTATVWAYGNSRGDLRMLGAADFGVDASRLGRFGRLHRYPGLDNAPLRPDNAAP